MRTKRVFISIAIILAICTMTISTTKAESTEVLPINKSARSFIVVGSNIFYITPDLKLYGFGLNENGIISDTKVDGKYKAISTPLLIASDVVQVEKATYSYLYVTKNNECVVWYPGDVGKLASFAYSAPGRKDTGKGYVIPNVKYVSSAVYKDLIVQGNGEVFLQDTNGGFIGEYKYNQFLTFTPFTSGVLKVLVSKFHMLALGESGKLYGWGFNKSGQITSNNIEMNPKLEKYNIIKTPMVIAENVIDFSSSELRTVYINNKGELWEQGLDSLFYNDLSDYFWPQPKMSFPSIKGLLGGGLMSTLRGLSKYVDNLNDYVSSYYQPDNSGKVTPKQLFAPRKLMDGAKKVSAGFLHTLVINDKNELYAYGYNKYGAVGNGTNEPVGVPIKIMDNVVEIYAHKDQSFAITKNGELWGWGNSPLVESGTFKPTKIADGIFVKTN